MENQKGGKGFHIFLKISSIDRTKEFRKPLTLNYSFHRNVSLSNSVLEMHGAGFFEIKSKVF